MPLRLLILLALAVSLRAVEITELPPPPARGASGGSLATAPDGTVWLTWLQPAAAGATTLRCSTLDLAQKKWRAPRTIASGAHWLVNWADFPALALGARGRATAVWSVENPPAPAGAAAAHSHHGSGYRAFFSNTTDAGVNWSAPAPLTTESDSVEFVSLATLADGRVLAAWLDGRAKNNPAAKNAQRLYARLVGAPGPDTLLDASVCDCCQTTLTAFPDGGALLAYRGRSPDELRDIRTARFDGREWDDSRPLANDEWRIAGCPVNGPQLASDGGRVAAAWFTAAGQQPRVLASFSPDAGARFLQPLRLDGGAPLGRVDTLLLHDGALLVTWLEGANVKNPAAPAGLWLRRMTPEFAADEPVLLAPADAARATGFPRTALARDYAGGDSTAALVVVFTETAENVSSLRTLLVTVPEGALLAAQDHGCHCAPTPEQLAGFPIRGAILAVSAGKNLVRLRHPEVPGVLPAGTREFHVAPAVLATLPAGRQCLARIEQRDGAWWLYDVRLLAGAPAK